MYSFGVILYQMLSGEVPRRGNLDLGALWGRYPDDLLRTLEACLTHQPEQRPTSEQAARLVGSFVVEL